jgi:predicted kinase
MEAIIFCGIQATGKSTFYKTRFFKTHVRISLDLLKTRHREQQFLKVCLSTRQAFVVDNTNPTKQDRQKYIESAKALNFKVIGYYFKSNVKDALARNKQREGKENIAEAGIRGTFAKLERPCRSEGFDALFYVEINNNDFIIKEWQHEI